MNDHSAIIKNLVGDRNIPSRLMAHLNLVHGVEQTILTWLKYFYPEVTFHEETVLFGALTHDIGKVVATDELYNLGSTHEKIGFQLLINHGINANLARFTLTHSTWTSSDTNIEDWLVSLADKTWKEKRVMYLEERTVNHICHITNKQKWEVFLELDDLINEISKEADQRLAFQSKFRID
jgi:hypothetical protein